MTTTRYFPIKVTGCKDCPYKKHEFTVSYCDLVMPQDKCFELYKQNFKKLTDSCPMWSETKESETK